ncbi:MAG: hypothetical protein WDM81_13150 [Rhizomicrobium sp.]
MHENLFDMNHQFLHRSLMGTIKATCLGRRQGEDWCEVDYTFTRTAGSQSLGEAAILNVMRAPEAGVNADLMTIRTGYPYQNLKVWVNGGDPVLDVWLGYTPLDAEQKTNRTFGYLSVKRPKIPASSTPPGRSSPGSPKASSPRTSTSWSRNRRRMTPRAATATTRSSPRSATCAPSCCAAASRWTPPL